jgi:hypothetical protein
MTGKISLARGGRAGHDGYFFDPVCTNHLNVAVRAHEGQIVHAIRDGAQPLITLDSLPRDPYTLQVYPLGRFYPHQGVWGLPVI